MFAIGDQRVGIELDTPQLDDDGNPLFDDLGGELVDTVTLWVDGALFEAQTPTEQPDVATTTSDRAIATLPIASDLTIPTVNANGYPAPLTFFTPNGRPAINANTRLTHDGLRYEMRGDAVLERDIRGRANHVFCSCERTQ